MKNIDIRKKLEETGVKHWELAEAFGVHPSTLCAKLRRELPEDEKARLCEIIDRLAEGKEVTA
ncbi:MAG: hypothetical protein IJ386_08745 [Clostridia bacterium]|nr:hypothetical protein [Clostridia bacterium]